jgi:hypothetical protein
MTLLINQLSSAKPDRRAATFASRLLFLVLLGKIAETRLAPFI